jgi:thiol-disulfide isomerase/thioredoxin
MKILLLFILSVSLFQTGCSTTRKTGTGTTSFPESTHLAINETPVNFYEQSTWLLGYINPVQMHNPPHSEWYRKGYDEYQYDRDIVNKLTEIDKDELTIIIVLGTWCPDSRREVPRFMRILDIWEFPAGKVEFIGVDNAKLSPVGEYDKLNIERVPTFIIYRNNIEAGRIIENPLTSLEQDMINILTRNE